MNRFLSAAVLLIVSCILLIGCEKKVPTVGVDPMPTPTTETMVQTDRKKSDNEDTPIDNKDTAIDHEHIAISYEIDKDCHQYVCSVCNAKVKSAHSFPGGVSPCVKCQAKKYIYPGSGYTVIKAVDGYGNVTEEKLYDAEGNMAYDRGYVYTYDNGIIVERTDYENNIKIGSHKYKYYSNGNYIDSSFDVDGVLISERTEYVN